MDGWEKQASKQIQIPSGHSPNPLAHTRVQFHQDQTHVLVVHASQLAIYAAPKLDSMKQVCCYRVSSMSLELCIKFLLNVLQGLIGSFSFDIVDTKGVKWFSNRCCILM